MSFCHINPALESWIWSNQIWQDCDNNTAALLPVLSALSIYLRLVKLSGHYRFLPTLAFTFFNFNKNPRLYLLGNHASLAYTKEKERQGGGRRKESRLLRFAIQE